MAGRVVVAVRPERPGRRRKAAAPRSMLYSTRRRMANLRYFPPRFI